MDRRAFIAGLGAVLAARRAAGAQPAAKAYRIGTLTVSPADRASHYIVAFEEGLTKLGYVKGSRIIYEHRFAEGHVERLPDLVKQLIAVNVDVILAGHNASILAAKNASSPIPIVMTYSVDPVGVGFIRSLSHPGGNITGLTADVSAETSAKRLGLVNEIAPRASQIGILWNPAFPGAAAAWKVTGTAARALGVRLQSIEIRSLEDVDRILAAMATRRPGALLVLADPLGYTRRREIAAAALRYRLPAVFEFREGVDDGGLMSYGVNIPSLYRRAASYVDRILNGAKPADLPVEQPTSFELVINLKTAKALGLTIPPSLLARADQVIE